VNIQNQVHPVSSSAKSLPLAQLLGHAAEAVRAVREGQSLTTALANCPEAARPGTQALAFEVLRGLGAAMTLRASLVPKEPSAAIDAILLSALALLWSAPTSAGANVKSPMYADHTVVNQAVEAARQRVPASAGLVNAVLRRFLREREALQHQALQHPLARWNHPIWWHQALQRDWPDAWQNLLARNNEHPPMTLRVNANRGTVANYLERLAQVGLSAKPWSQPLAGQLVPHGIVLDVPCPVARLPGFDAGDVSVQDAAAQLAAPLLLQALRQNVGSKPAAGWRVLDACAAPGGKTAHLLELAGLCGMALELHAIDVDAQRLRQVEQTLARLNLKTPDEVLASPPVAAFASSGPPWGQVSLGNGLATDLKGGVFTQVADAAQPSDWWDGRLFDAILLDAPCTSSGVIRRHPDIRWLRRESDVNELARLQSQMLHALWPLLAPGGCLLYATCSVFKAEGSNVVGAFMQACPDAHSLPSPGHVLSGHAAKGEATADGFFYAVLQKRSGP
jgi:16S rRNA (cytosine967-C5)-methyltransferase